MIVTAIAAVGAVLFVLESPIRSPGTISWLPAVLLSGWLVALLIGVGMYATFAFLPEFVQTPAAAGYGFGASIIHSGLMLLPSAVTMFVTGLFASHARYAHLLLDRSAESAAEVEIRAAVEELTARALAAGTLHPGVTAGDVMALIWAMRGLTETTSVSR